MEVVWTYFVAAIFDEFEPYTYFGFFLFFDYFNSRTFFYMI